MNKAVGLFLIISFFSGCSSSDKKNKTPAETLFQEASKDVKKKRYLVALEKLNIIRSQYPYSFYATHAELLQADVYFLQENFKDASASYSLFKEFHPKHEKAVYVLWKLAESYRLQLPKTFDRDLLPALDAIKYYKELVNRYPDSEYAPQALEKIKICEKMLENKEKYIADFYYKTKEYLAAQIRYLRILQNFQDETLVQHAMLRVVETSFRLKKYDECVRYSKLYEELSNQQNRKILESLQKSCQLNLKQEESS